MVLTVFRWLHWWRIKCMDEYNSVTFQVKVFEIPYKHENNKNPKPAIWQIIFLFLFKTLNDS